MAERWNAVVLPAGSFGKTVEGQLSGGSPKDPVVNPSLFAQKTNILN